MPELVAKVDPVSRLSVVDTEFPTEVKFDFLPEEVVPRGLAAFISVQEGCDNPAAFVLCRTRAVLNFLAQLIRSLEAKRLVMAGTREITLLGQNVNAWQVSTDGTNWGLGRLIEN